MAGDHWRHDFRPQQRRALALLGVLLAALLAFGAPAMATAMAPEVSPAPPPPPTSPCATCWVLLGDSVAHSFSGALQAEAARHGIFLTTATRSGCGMITALTVSQAGKSQPWAQHCADETAAYQSNAMRNADASVAIWESTWELGYHVFNGQRLTLGDPAGNAAMLDELEAAVQRITAGGANGRLVILTVVPRAEHSFMVDASAEDLRVPPLLNGLYHVLELRHPGVVSVVELGDIVCPGGPPCPQTVDGIQPRPRDGGHFEGDGPTWLAPKLLAAIVEALQRSSTATDRTGHASSTARFDGSKH
jgi:hypothetical protein